jgi:HK97 family phage major capsid protein
MAAIRSKTAYDEPIQGRATTLVPAGAVAPDWLPPIAYGREPRIAEHVTNAGGVGSEADWLEVTTPAVALVVAEGAAKPDSGLVLTRKSAAYEKLANWTDASMELLNDFNSTQALINMELLGAVNTLENGEIVAAISGNANILNVTVVGTSRLHAILQAQAAVRAGASKAWPDMVLMNPTDWPSTIGQEATTSGAIQAGAAVVVDGTGTRLWGMDVFLTVAVTAGTAFVGLASAVLYVTRDPAHVIVDPWTQLKSNLVTTVAEMRSKAGLQRPQSWSKVTLPAAGTPAAEVSEQGEPEGSKSKK